MLTPTTSSTSRAAVRSMSSYAARACSASAPAARSLAFSARSSPASSSSLRSHSCSLLQLPRLQSLNAASNKRAFGTTVTMVC